MNLSNLKEGMIIKNYRELCKLLEVEERKGGNAKRKQIKWFEDYFTYERSGHSYIIRKIYDKEVMPMEDERIYGNNITGYIANIELLILDILSKSGGGGKIFLSRNKLFYTLAMVNINYLDAHYKVDKLSTYLDINKSSVQDWLNSTKGLLERNLETALKSLARQSLIMWSKEITVCVVEPIVESEYLVPIVHTNKYGEENIEYVLQHKTRRINREATDEEKKNILRAERNILSELNCDNKQEVIRKGLWEEFQRNVEDIIKKKHNIVYYYQSYKIISNPDHIKDKWNKVNSQLSDEEKELQKQIVNALIMDRITKNAESRQELAVTKLSDEDDINKEEDIPNRIIVRADDKYVEHTRKLSNALINTEAKDIRKDIRTIDSDE